MGRPKTALIVDDETHVRAFLRVLLRELGILTCWEAADGASALTMAAEHKPELVLLDINLPIMGGLQVLAEFQETYPEIPVVVVSAQTSTGTVKESANLGAVGYIIKHRPKEQLMTALNEVLDSLEGMDEESDYHV